HLRTFPDRMPFSRRSGAGNRMRLYSNSILQVLLSATRLTWAGMGPTPATESLSIQPEVLMSRVQRSPAISRSSPRFNAHCSEEGTLLSLKLTRQVHHSPIPLILVLAVSIPEMEWW